MSVLKKNLVKFLISTNNFFVFVFPVHAQNTLLPPWSLLNAQLKAVLSGDPCIKVGNLSQTSSVMEIKINACNSDKAKSLAAFINSKYEFGNITVAVQVYSQETIPVYAEFPTALAEAANTLSQALTGNPYFLKAGIGEGERRNSVYAEFKPRVIHYFSDDLEDWKHETNVAAATAFKEVFKLDAFANDGKIRIYTGTREFN